MERHRDINKLYEAINFDYDPQNKDRIKQFRAQIGAINRRAKAYPQYVRSKAYERHIKSQYCACCLKTYDVDYYFGTHIHTSLHKKKSDAFKTYLLSFTDDADDDTIDKVVCIMLCMYDYDRK
jgi:hypothetical protein